MTSLFNDAPAGTTIDNIGDFESYMKSTTELSDFGMKIKDRNIFYFMYLKDKLSKSWGLSIMIGEKVIFDYTYKGKEI